MNQGFKLLLVSDSMRDRALLTSALGLPASTAVHVADIDGLRDALTREPWDAVLCAAAMAQLPVVKLLPMVDTMAGGTPVIVIADEIGPEAAVDLMRAGAADVILRENLSQRLQPALARECALATERQHAASDAAEFVRAEQQLHSLAQNFPGVMYQRAMAGDGSISYPFVSGRGLEFGDRGLAPAIGDVSDLMKAVLPEDREQLQRQIADSARDLTGIDIELRYRVQDADIRWVRSLSQPRRQADGGVVWDAVAIDVTEQKAALEALGHSEQRLALLQGVALAIAEARDFDTALTAALKLVCENTGWSYGITWLPDRERNVLAPGPSWHIDDPRLEALDRTRAGTTFAPGEGAVGRAWSTRSVQWNSDVQVFAVAPSARLAAMHAAGLRSVFAVPIIVDDEVLAVFGFGMIRLAQEDRHILDSIAAVAAQIGSALKRKRIEQALHESQERFEATFMNAPVGISHIGLDGRFTLVNDALCNMLGYGRDELLQCTFDTLTHPDDRSSTRDRVTQLFNGEIERVTIEKRNIRPDGSIVWVSVTSTIKRDVSRKPVYMISVVVDISARKAVEQRLQQSEARYRELIDVLPNGIIVHVDGRIAFANPAAARLLGAEAPELLHGMRALDILHPDEHAAAAQNIKDTLSGKIDYRAANVAVDRRVICFDGSEKIAELTAIPIGFDGKPGLLIAGTDISERKQAEAERRALEAQLRQLQKMEAIGNLTGGIAHDFNNLLTVVLGNLELVQEQVPPDDTIAKRVAAAVAAAHRGADLTHRLLAFSRQQPLQPTRIAVPAQLAEALPMLVRTLGSTIAVEADLAADTWPVDVDASQLDNAVLNLAINARDAMPDGGRLSIASRNVVIDEHDAAEAEMPPGDYVRIAVRDTGTGMPEHVRERVFDPFFTTKPVGKGTGLGLSMVYGFVKQSGGHVSIESVVGRGTEVALLLPRAGNALALPGEQPVQVSTDSGGETILVVEDDPGLRSLAVTMLSGFGYDVLAAASGAEGFMLLTAHPEVDLLFSDVMLADGMNGAELGRRARELRPDLRILYTTGYTQDAFSASEIEQEGFLLLHKPYRRLQLGEMVRLALTAAAR